MSSYIDEDSDDGSDGPVSQRRSSIVFVAAFTLSVTTVAVSLRLYTRRFIIHQLGSDDWCALVSLILTIGCSFAATYNLNYGLGLHIWDVNDGDLANYKKTLYVSIVLYNAALMAIKTTFLAQYRRIFTHTSRTVHMFFVASSLSITAMSTAQLLISIFVCNPIRGYWDSAAAATCIPEFPLWQINAACSILGDFLTFILPILVIRKLNIPRRQRYGLLAIFSLGLFTICISLIRIRYLKQNTDYTWENVESSGWSEGELALGLTCACLPTLRPLITHAASPRGHAHNSTVFSYPDQHEQSQGHHHRYDSTGQPLTSSHSQFLGQATAQKGDVELGLAGLVGLADASRLHGAAALAAFRNLTSVSVDRTASHVDSTQTRTPSSSLSTSTSSRGPSRSTSPLDRSGETIGDAVAGRRRNASASEKGHASTAAQQQSNIALPQPSSPSSLATRWLCEDRVGWMGAVPGIQTEVSTPPPTAISASPADGGFPASAILVERNIYQRKEPAEQ